MAFVYGFNLIVRAYNNSNTKVFDATISIMAMYEAMGTFIAGVTPNTTKVIPHEYFEFGVNGAEPAASPWYVTPLGGMDSASANTNYTWYAYVQPTSQKILTSLQNSSPNAKWKIGFSNLRIYSPRGWYVTLSGYKPIIEQSYSLNALSAAQFSQSITTGSYSNFRTYTDAGGHTVRCYRLEDDYTGGLAGNPNARNKLIWTKE